MSGHAAPNQQQLIQLLETKRCRQCQLQDADLVHADLRDADLRGAKLQGANLGQAQMDRANLQGADLTMTSLEGASLRGSNLQGSILMGSDLRGSDLSGAQLTPGALATAHWQGATGMDHRLLSYVELHNSGVRAAAVGRYPEAEIWFSEAIRQQPEAGLSWVARGISRGAQGKRSEASTDFSHAATLYATTGDLSNAELLKQAAAKLNEEPKTKSGNGTGSAVLGAAISAVQALAPLIQMALLPLGL